MSKQMEELENKVINAPKFCPECQKIFDKYWKGMVACSDKVHLEMKESMDKTFKNIQEMTDEIKRSNDDAESGEDWKNDKILL